MVESAEWTEGGGFDSFKSTQREEPEVDEVDDKFLDAFFSGHGIYLPACYPKSKGKAPWLAVMENSAGKIDRADLFALGGQQPGSG